MQNFEQMLLTFTRKFHCNLKNVASPMATMNWIVKTADETMGIFKTSQDLATTCHKLKTIADITLIIQSLCECVSTTKNIQKPNNPDLSKLFRTEYS